MHFNFYQQMVDHILNEVHMKARLIVGDGHKCSTHVHVFVHALTTCSTELLSEPWASQVVVAAIL